MFFHKILVKIYTDCDTLKRAPLTICNKKYFFDTKGYLELYLRPKSYDFKILNFNLTYSFVSSDRVYYIFREDNDCHFNVIIKDISINEFNKMIKNL